MPHEPCHSTFNQLNYEIEQLKEYNQLLLSQHLQRKRRGYVNGIGNLARTLFGVLDDNFAQKYSEDIQKVKNNEQYLLELIRNQTLIIEAENNIIKKNEEFVNTQFETIRRNMQQTQNDLTEIHHRVQIMSTMNDINSGAITASLLITTLRRTQEMILNALTDIYRGHLDMNLFTPEQLKEQLNVIAGVISKKLTLPIKTDDASNIYKIIYVKARLTEKYLLFELHIPLISDEEYSLYHIMPIPRQVTHDQCKVISITSPYIAVNFAKNTYLQIEDTDLQQCTTVMDDSYICHAYKPISSLHSQTASCEAKMLSHNVNITCDWDQQKCADQWRKLHRPNIWLFNCITECPARIVCENQVTTSIITMAGLLALGQDCIIQHKDTTIYSYNIFGSKTKIGIDLPVPTIDSPNDLVNTYKTRTMMLGHLDASEQHQLLDKQINVQKEHEFLPNDITVHDVGNYTISTFLVGGIAIIILWKYRHRILSCKKDTKANAKSPKKDEKKTDTEDIELQEITTNGARDKEQATPPKPTYRREFRF
ncbi:baculovirus F protein domain-containing protein [Phthorimaea operculella]|nr:baculovirus F protein domain-containing protein [Phthorimaea operculella]